MTDLKIYKRIYERNLLESVIPFWADHSLDREFGGYFTCLLSDGSVYDRDKFVWLQARQIWTFSKLYNEYEKRQDWLDIAEHGAQFLKKFGRDQQGQWYFSLAQDGRPLIQPYNIFSDCFATMAFAQLYKATENITYKTIARESFENVLTRQHNSKRKYNKAYPGTRPLENFALPMILCNLTMELKGILDQKDMLETISTNVEKVLSKFYQPDLGIIIENIDPQGQRSDSMNGRLVNPGHAIEACWFIMEVGECFNQPSWIQKASEICLNMMSYGWDDKFGGIFYFLDHKGFPLQQLEWDQKLWWPHCESIIACLKAYRLTSDVRFASWFEKIHSYTWDRFVDTEHGEWFGYLHRDGSRLNNLKGGKWKGCFHVPRTLFFSIKELTGIEAAKNSQ